MGQIHDVQPVKLFIGMLSSLSPVLEEVIPILETRFGDIDVKTSTWPFDFTNYYCREMGSSLGRQFISFRRLIDPGILKEIKIWTNGIERQLSSRYEYPLRPVNLDPGYLCLSKVVLATTKDYHHRIYLGDGIYGEVTLNYCRKQFRPCAWTYPDYQDPRYTAFFEDLRKIYHRQLKELAGIPQAPPVAD